LAVLLGTGILSSGAFADEYVNGWTEDTFRSGVNGCVASAVPRQMQLMVDSGQLKKDATSAEVDSVRARVTTIVIATCTCVQHRIMHDVRFEEVSSIRQRPEVVRQVMTECSAAVVKKK
jgi:hypothetical protein